MESMITIKKPEEYQGMEKQVLAPLYSVIDPELHINIVDMGLIYDIEVDDEKNIFITMTLSTRFCPMGEAITGGILRVLQKTFPEYEVHIEVTFDPPWSLERLTPEGVKMLMAG